MEDEEIEKETLFSYLKNSTPPYKNDMGHFVVDETNGLPLYIASYFDTYDKPLVIVTSNLYKANIIFNTLVSYMPTKKILLFPSDDMMKSEVYSTNKEFMSSRVYALNEILNNRVDIIITNVSALMRKYPSRDLFKENTISFNVGHTYNFDSIKKTLAKMGYINVSKIDQTFQYSVRGDIIDVFSLNYDNPVRLEFFDDQLESIRFFDIATQEKTKELKKVEFLPASDFLIDEDTLEHIDDVIKPYLDKSLEPLNDTLRDRLEVVTTNDIDDIKNQNINNRSYFYMDILSPSSVLLFDYLKDFNFIYASMDSINESYQLLERESDEYLASLINEGDIIKGASYYNQIDHYLLDKNSVKTIDFSEKPNDYHFDFLSFDYTFNKIEDIPFNINRYLNEGYKVVISLSSRSELRLIEKELSDSLIVYQEVTGFYLPDKGSVGIQVWDIPNGFISRDKKILYLSSKEVFNTKAKTNKYVSRFKEGSIIRSYEDLEVGDYVVHEYQGIARYDGLVTLEEGKKHQDYLKLIFKNDEIYYVPLSQFHVVRKYMGREGYKPALSALHSKSWEKKKEAIKERVNDLAERLVQLSVIRSSTKGFKFDKDDEIQKQFEADFPYELTPDQDKALKDVKADMEDDKVMDRIICGDVGFGKTEIAFRAAFKAILSGKQVVLLCPTTLLARQHYERALERFTPYGVHVCLLSRLNTNSVNEKNIKLINEGKMDLIIGTHKLLSKKIKFPNLGLFIVDEEQRFGVEQKERIKEMQTNVDVLTLSATPIPRTLQIALLGVRQLSLITTPPKDRMPIQTFVTPYKEEIVKELIERELSRNGQVFFLHNNTETIYNYARRLQDLIPNATIAVAHGKMDKTDLEDVMDNFYSGKIDVLVTTSIIENGIDIPNANMIIVSDADKYGLSQLYQIKGRVGRSDKISYAYLMYNEYKVLNEGAKKRLKTLQEFTSLGSGYKIAQRDLMIRGAGDILGPEQAGFIDSIGLDMYMKLLNESVNDKLNNEKETLYKQEVIPYLSMDAYIPDSYASDSDKISLYQEIQSAETLSQVNEVKQKTQDIYGKMPKNVEYVFTKREIDILSNEAHITSFVEQEKSVTLTLSNEYLEIEQVGSIIFEAMIPYLSLINITYKKNTFTLTISKRAEWFNDLREILKLLTNVYNIRRNSAV